MGSFLHILGGVLNLWTPVCILHLQHTSQFGLTTVQVLDSQMGLMVNTLDNMDLDSC